MRNRSNTSPKWIIAPLFDSLFFLLCPLLALAAAFIVYQLTPLASVRVFPDYFLTWDQFLISALNQAHLIAVFGRSHANREVFRAFPMRFTVVPLIALAVALSGEWGFYALAALGLLWGEYHSSLQTFGLMRLYHARAGNDPAAGRTWDLWLGHALYFTPLLAGPNLDRLLTPFALFRDLSPWGLALLPSWVHSHQNVLATLALIGGIGIALGYSLRLWQSNAEDRRWVVFACSPKTLLVAATALTCAISWGRLPLYQAIFVMQFFHAIQYFAILWATEKKRLGLDAGFWFRTFLVLCATYGIFAIMAKTESKPTFALSVVIVVSLCHLWFDGFIWSVSRRKANIVQSTPL